MAPPVGRRHSRPSCSRWSFFEIPFPLYYLTFQSLDFVEFTCLKLSTISHFEVRYRRYLQSCPSNARQTNFSFIDCEEQGSTSLPDLELISTQAGPNDQEIKVFFREYRMKNWTTSDPAAVLKQNFLAHPAFPLFKIMRLQAKPKAKIQSRTR